MSSPHTPPTVQTGDVIVVHLPRLEGAWRVDAVLEHAVSGDYFLRISQRINGVKVVRTISPRGYQVVDGHEAI